MKRIAFLKHMKLHDCILLREGGKHSVYWNPDNLATSSVPRHREISDKLVRKICRDLAIPIPEHK